MLVGGVEGIATCTERLKSLEFLPAILAAARAMEGKADAGRGALMLDIGADVTRANASK